ncbi:Mpv17 / PMP22 family protein, partial [Opisthorchis viverrini]
MGEPSAGGVMKNSAKNDQFNYWITRVPLLARSRKYTPLFKNLIIGGGLMMVGEVVAQEIKYCLSTSHQENNVTEQDLPSTTGEKMNGLKVLCGCWRNQVFSTTHIDIYGVARLGFIGTFQGFYQHFYYTWLDRKLIGSSALVVAKKVVLDEVLVGPASLLVFFVYNGYCNTKSLKGGVEHAKNLFWPAYFADLAFWPLVQSINFAFLPTRYRVPYIALFMCIWNSYLCLLNSRK